jgi:hypothetical protein
MWNIGPYGKRLHRLADMISGNVIPVLMSITLSILFCQGIEYCKWLNIFSGAKVGPLTYRKE